MPLKDIVLQIIDRVGGKRESVYGQKVATQCFCYGLLELIRSDGTKAQFSKTDGEHPIICAAPINPAEAVWVEPREGGPHFVRRPATPSAPPAEPPQSPATATPPADRQLSDGPRPSQSPQAQQQSEPRRSSPATQSGEPAIADRAPSPTSAAGLGDQAGAANPLQPPQAPRQPGGRPTDRDMVLEEAAWRLRNRKTKAKSVAAFARELRTWLEVHGEHRSHGDVMKAETIEDHVRPLWNQHRGKTI
jgi:hypothetical protein